MPEAISKNLSFLLPGNVSWDDFSDSRFQTVEKKEYWGDGVCGWAAVSPYETIYRRFDSMKAGVLWMRDYGRDKGWSNHGDAPHIDFYPACSKCTKDGNFHHFDDKKVRYVVGPKGGIRKVKGN